MKHWTGLYTHGALLAVANVTQLSDGRLPPARDACGCSR